MVNEGSLDHCWENYWNIKLEMCVTISPGLRKLIIKEKSRAQILTVWLSQLMRKWWANHSTCHCLNISIFIKTVGREEWLPNLTLWNVYETLYVCFFLGHKFLKMQKKKNAVILWWPSACCISSSSACRCWLTRWFLWPQPASGVNIWVRCSSLLPVCPSVKQE